MKNKTKNLLLIIIGFYIICVPSITLARGEKLAIIAPSVSTSIESKEILNRNGWVESNFRQAQGILVVVRSMLFNPLNDTYDSIDELNDDADSQLNISGDNFHIYIYQINDDLSVRQLKHVNYKAND